MIFPPDASGVASQTKLKRNFNVNGSPKPTKIRKDSGPDSFLPWFLPIKNSELTGGYPPVQVMVAQS